MKIGKTVFIIFLAFSILMSGCGSNKTLKGGAIGAAVGGAIGGVMGERSGKTVEGILIGAAIGGAAGAAIGAYMDKQARELQEDLKDAKVERIGEGIKITFNSGILFKVNSDELTAEARKNIDNLAGVLKKYDDTNILIQGHTDSTGTADYNLKLSERRAASVASFVKRDGVEAGRLSTVGYGKTMPIADNGSENGRQQNRRVEIAIFANERLKKAAERGDI